MVDIHLPSCTERRCLHLRRQSITEQSSSTLSEFHSFGSRFVLSENLTPGVLLEYYVSIGILLGNSHCGCYNAAKTSTSRGLLTTTKTVNLLTFCDFDHRISQRSRSPLGQFSGVCGKTHTQHTPGHVSTRTKQSSDDPLHLFLVASAPPASPPVLRATVRHESLRYGSAAHLCGKTHSNRGVASV